MQGQEQDLRRDIESYLRGEHPSRLELLRAPHLEEWEILIGSVSLTAHVRGVVTKHPEVDDGLPISTSSLVWMDRKFRWCRTMTRVYALGEQASS